MIAIRFQRLHKQRFKDPESSAEEIEDESYTDNRDDEEVNESEKKPSGYAFLNLKKPEFKEKKIEKDNLVGLATSINWREKCSR